MANARRDSAVDSKIFNEAFECCKGQNCDIHSGGSRSVLSKGPVTSWTSITNMPKEISEYAIDYPAFTDVKGRDIERHSTDEKLDSFQRAMVCLKGGEIAEKIFVASKFDNYVRENTNRAFTEILPLLIVELETNKDSDLHAAASQSMMQACHNLYGKNVKQAKELLQLIFKHVDSESPSISESWTRALNSIMDKLSPKELEKEFAPVITEKAKNMTSVNARRAACILLRKLMTKGSVELGTQLKALVRPLCQDASPIVRACICLQLATIYQATQFKDELLLNLSILSKDSDQRVKCCFISTISKIVKLPDMKFFFGDTVPLIKRIVKEAYVTGHIELLQEFSSSMGEMAKILSEAGVLDGNNKLWFLDAGVQLCRYGLASPTTGVEVESLIGSATGKGTPTPNSNSIAATQGWICRMNAASGFSNFVKFAKPLVDFKTGLHPLIVDLIHDINPKVRAAMAGNIWPIMEILGSAGHQLSGEFVYALSDDDLAVIEGIIPNMSQILQVLVQGKVISPENMTPALVEVVGAIMFCEERLHNTNNWRIHSSLLSQLSVLPYCVPCDYIFTNVVPNLFHRLLHLRQLPSRLAAADAIISFLRNCRRAGQREEIRRRIKESFAEGRSVQDRMLYLFMSKMIIDNFSRKYFRDHFFEQTLNMAEDNVANVRMKVVGLMPEMKGTLKTAEDDVLLKKLEEVVNKIRNSETDRDVQNAIQDALVEMKKIGVVFDKDKTPNNSNAKKIQKTKQDAEDEAKEKEEAYIESLEKTLPDINKRDKKDYYRNTGQNSAVTKPLQPVPIVQKKPEGIQAKDKISVTPGAPNKGKVNAATRNPGKDGSVYRVPEPPPSPTQDTKKEMNVSIVEAERLRRRTLVPTQVALLNNKQSSKKKSSTAQK